MRLPKKIAAVALAAVMAVSMLTAFGSTGGPSSSGSSSAGSNSSSNSSSTSGSSKPEASSPDGSSNGSSNSGTEDKEETVAYKNSRTAKFYQKLGTSYTMGAKLDFTMEGASGTADMLVVTNGSRTYQQVTTQSDDSAATQTMLVEMTKQKVWVLLPDESVKDQGKLGYCYSSRIIGSAAGGDISDKVTPIDGLKFTQKTKGNYYVETQTYEITTEDGTVKMVISYCYEGNSSTPKYTETKEYLGGKEVAMSRMTFTSIERKVDAKYLDFEPILKQYIDVTDKINPSTAQALEPSIAGLTIG